jgi:CCR4-NOT transcription complex subunit 1
MFPDHYILKLVETNLDLTCLVVENVAVKRALLEVDKALEPEYETRRIHRQLRPNLPFWNPKNPVPEFASALPIPLRIHPNGVTPEQNQIYEDFNRRKFTPRPPCANWD